MSTIQARRKALGEIFSKRGAAEDLESYSEERLRRILSKFIFQGGGIYKDNERVADFVPTHKEIEHYLSLYNEMKDLATDIIGRFERLKSKYTLLFSKSPFFEGKNLEEEVFITPMGLRHLNTRVTEDFMRKFSNTSYGYSKFFQKEVLMSYSTREQVNMALEKHKRFYLGVLNNIPTSIDEVLEHYELSSEEELIEASAYSLLGISHGSNVLNFDTKYELKDRDGIINPIKFSGMHPLDLIRLGRNYRKLNIKYMKYKDPRSYFDYTGEVIGERSDEAPEGPNRNTIEKITEREINDRFNYYYEISDMDLIEAIREELMLHLNKSLDKKLGEFNKFIKAYKLNPDVLGNLKEEILLESPVARLMGFSGYHNLKSSPYHFIRKLKGYKELFLQEVFKSYSNVLEGNSKEELSVNLEEAIAEADRKIAQRVRASGLESIFQDGIRLIMGRPDEHIDKIDGTRYYYILNERVFITSLNGIFLYNHEKAQKSPEVTAQDNDYLKKSILISRMKDDGFSGYRNMRTYLKDNLKNHDPDFLFKYEDGYFDEVNEIIEAAKTSGESKEDVNAKVIKYLENPRFSEGADEHAKYQVWRDFFPKVIMKMYREEEAFMTGRTEELFERYPNVKSISKYEAHTLEDEDAVVKERTWGNFIAVSDIHTVSTPSYFLKLLNKKDTYNSLTLRIINFLISIFPVEEFNSIERMEKFLFALNQLYLDIRKNRGIYNLDNLKDPKDMFKKLTGSRKERILKMLEIVNLSDNYSKIKEDIETSKFVDKFDLNIFQTAIKIYNDLVIATEGLTNKEFLDNIISLKKQLSAKISDENVEKLFSKELINTLSLMSEYKSLDSFLEGMNISSRELEGSTSIELKALMSKIKSGIEIYNQVETLFEYYDVVEDKDPNLFKANMSGEGFRFRVLEGLDPYHFQVGSDTDCCQAIGGEGEMAAVDSFINGQAGVLLLEILSKGSWELVTQSYFHYVPKKNMIILDNIEAGDWTSEEARKTIRAVTGYSFPELYALLGKHLESNGIKEVLVGDEYTMIIGFDDFKKDKRRNDPRRFKTEEEYGDTYTDYDPSGSINLLKPKFKITRSEISASYIPNGLKKVALYNIDISPLFSKNNQIASGKLIKLCEFLKQNSLSKELRAARRLLNGA